MSAPSEFVRGSWAVAARNLRVWRHYAAASALGNFGEPVLYLLALGYGLGQVVPAIGGMSYAEFIAPGLIMTTVMYTATFEGCFGSYTRLTTQGTFEAMLATPITVGELTAGEVLWGGIKATFGAVAVLTVVALFGLAPSPLALLTIPLAFVSGLMFTALALAVTSLSKSYESFNYYFTLVLAPMFLFCGVFFPIDRAPGWVAPLAQILPLTHVVALARAFVRGTPSASIAINAGVIVGVLCVAYALCAWLLARRLRM